MMDGERTSKTELRDVAFFFKMKNDMMLKLEIRAT